MKVTVVHLMPTLMERQLDPNAGYLLQKRDRGARHRDSDQRQHQGDPRQRPGRGRRLEDGRILPADIVVMAVGIRPNAALAKEAGLEVKRGIVVDDTMRTSDPDIYAVGECVEHRGQCYGLVAPLYEMAKDAGRAARRRRDARLRGSSRRPSSRSPASICSRPAISPKATDREEIVLRDPSRGIYKRVVLRDNRIVGAVLYGDTADGSWYFDLLKKGADIAEMRDTLIFGQAYQGGGAARSGGGRRSAVGRRGDLRLQRRLQGRDHQRDHGQGPDDARRRARAHQGVGLLRPMHREGRAAAAGDARRRLQSAAARKPMCKCTDLRTRKCAGSSSRRS